MYDGVSKITPVVVPSCCATFIVLQMTRERGREASVLLTSDDFVNTDNINKILASGDNSNCVVQEDPVCSIVPVKGASRPL